jgi:restriction endonuclease S subunit
MCDRWIGQSAVKRDKLLSLEITFPALVDEQQRIAETIKKMMADIEKARRGLEEQLEAVNSLPSALLRETLTDGI